jgi:putative hydrolase
MARRAPRMGRMSDAGPLDFGNLGDVPLFREIQRVLLAGSGPINWELARQIGIASAVWGKDDAQPTEDDRRGLEDTVRAAELHVAELTGLSAPAEVAPVQAVRRGEWVEATIEGLKDLVAPTALRVADAFTKAQLQDAPAEAAQMAQGVLGQLTPLLLGAQAGVVVGTLAATAFGRFDVAVPRRGPAQLSFVVPNIAAFERDWSLSPMEFRAWVALHEVAHRFEFARPWTYPHLLELIRDFASTLEIDVQGIRERLEQVDPSNPEALQGILQQDQSLFGGADDPEQRLKLARVQAFVAAAEGYGEHVTAALGRKLLGSYDRIVEALGRGHEDVDRDAVFSQLLGIEIRREHAGRGAAFCERVVEQTDEATLARMWDGPESLPSMPEIDEPTLWLARMV